MSLSVASGLPAPSFAPMTADELHHAEEIIQRGRETFVEVGQALLAIRDRKGYQLAGFKTFEDYVSERWGWSRRHAYRLMDGAEVAAECDHVVTISNEGTARELSRLKTPDGDLDLEAIKEVVKEAPGASVRGLKAIIDDRLQATTARTLLASGSFEYYTPAKYVEAAREVLGGIDLDPASCLKANQTVRAGRYFTEEQNGLEQEWSGQVFLNPPYSGLAGPFIARLIEHYKNEKVAAAVCLLNGHSTEKKWFAPLWDFVLCFTDHRIQFLGTSNGNTHGSVFVYLGPRPECFRDVFQRFGPIVRRWK